MSSVPVKRGMEFTHQNMFDPAWKPGPGQKYRDAPKARMVITHVTSTTVYFKYAGSGGPGAFSLDRAQFLT